MLEERRTKKRRVPANFSQGLAFAQKLLRSADISVHTAPSSKVLATTGLDTAELSTELDETTAHIAELESVETTTVLRQREPMDEIKQRHAQEVGVRKKTSAENVDSLINNVKVAKVDSVEMFVDRGLNLTCFEKHVQVVQALVNSNVEPNVTLTDAIAKV